MQLQVENHNKQLQEHLREQTNAGGVPMKNYNFVLLMGSLLGQFYKIFNSETCQLGHQIIDTLIELVQGPCRENQRALIGAKIIDYSRDFIVGFKKRDELRMLGFNPDNPEGLETIKHKLVQLLLSLLEGDVDQDIVARMSISLDLETMKMRLVDVFEAFVQQTLKLKPENATLQDINAALQWSSFDGPIQEGFNIYILLQKTYRNSTNDIKIEPGEKQKLAFEFFEHHIGQLEICINEVLQKVYFPIKPGCRMLTKATKTKILFNISRDNPKTKVLELISAAPNMIDEMKHNSSLEQYKMCITPKHMNFMRDVSFLLAIVQACTYTFTYTRVMPWEHDIYIEEIIPGLTGRELVGIIGIVQLIISMITLLFWFVIKGKLVVQQRWRELVSANKNQRDRYPIEGVSPEIRQLSMLYMRGPYSSEYTLEKQNILVTLTYILNSIVFLVQNLDFMYLVFYCMISIIGVLINPLYFSFQLLDLSYRYPILHNVIRSVSTNWRNLGMTSMLLMILVYIYTVIGFFFFHEMFYDYTINSKLPVPGEALCNDMWHCFMTMVYYGLRNGGGIGDTMKVQSFSNKEIYFNIFAYTFSFHIINIIVLLSIIAGIIIDTFA